MQAGQTMVDPVDGYEVALFPLVALYVYQGENTGSHLGTYNIDLHGYRYNGSRWVRQYNAPIYAPCTCKLVYKNPDGEAGGHLRIFQSVNPVHTPSGLKYITFYFGHDPSPPVNTIGQVCSQGSLIYHTGNYGESSGDHSHTCVGSGTWVNWSTSMTTRSSGHQDLTNHIHYWEGFYVNDTEILRTLGYNWQTYTPPVPPTPTDTGGKFPWFIYERKRRLLWK